ncbi:unnamed protein product [Sphenostylis stenocarpa]|uniref:Uncharacterized protein n=1 Tax=Sphenostylis stenocarpa TaxID=92480 RepID=A0AA86W3P4_9FABA|nr:unnamed protein product [Sphenostylis stenocarpa]
MQLKRGIMVFFSCETKGVTRDMEFTQTPSLPVVRYQDLKGHNCEGYRKEICSICLVEYEGKDAVSKLGKGKMKREQKGDKIEITESRSKVSEDCIEQ